MDGELLGMIAYISEVDISAEVEFSPLLLGGDAVKQLRNIVAADQWAVENPRLCSSIIGGRSGSRRSSAAAS